MAGLKYGYFFIDMDLDEIAIVREFYAKCGSMEDIFMCEISLRELEEKLDPRLKLKKDKINKILNDMESKEYITFIEKGKGRQKSIIRINIKDIINGKYEFKSMANKSKYKNYYK